MSTNAKPRLYTMMASPPCRTATMAAKILGVEIEQIPVNLPEKQQLSEELAPFLPFKRIPSFVDTDGFVMGESRAIAKYLVETRGGGNHFLYPADLKKRALIDQYLQFDLGTFYRALSDVVYGLFTAGKPDLEKLPRMYEIMQSLEYSMKSFTPSTPYLVGDSLTLADISLYYSLTLLDAIEQHMDWTKVPKVQQYLNAIDAALKKYDNDGEIQKGRDQLKEFAHGLAAKINAAQQ